jgi:hypothetical protein
MINKLKIGIFKDGLKQILIIIGYDHFKIIVNYIIIQFKLLNLLSKILKLLDQQQLIRVNTF